jgi:hypothetical protein
MFADSLALVAQEFPAGREHGTAMGTYGASTGAARSSVGGNSSGHFVQPGCAEW